MVNWLKTRRQAHFCAWYFSDTPGEAAICQLAIEPQTLQPINIGRPLPEVPTPQDSSKLGMIRPLPTFDGTRVNEGTQRLDEL